jgi:hypothetical protein
MVKGLLERYQQAEPLVSGWRICAKLVARFNQFERI